MRHLPTFLAIVATALFLAACGKKEAPVASGPTPVAIVGGEAILPEHLLQEIEWRQSNGHFIPPPDQLLQEMIDRLATVQRARREGLESDIETKRRIESNLIARLRETTLESQIREISITDQEIETAYQARINEFTTQALDRFSILFQAAPPKASEARRAEAKQRLETALKLATENPLSGGRGPAASGFGVLAVEYSDDQASRHRGGDIGWIETGRGQGRIPDSILSAGALLEVGAISPVLTADDGFYLIRKTESRPAATKPLSEVAEELRNTLLRDRRNAIEQSFVSSTRSAAAPKINADALKAVKFPPLRKPSATDEPPALPGVSTTR